MKTMNRKSFLALSGAAGLGVGLAGPSAFARQRVSANDRISLAFMGVNSRGSALARGFSGLDRSEIRYICDPDEQAIQKGIEAAGEGSQPQTPEGMTDFRRALEDPSLDAIVIACPIHWHTPAAILALQAGKHVYVEKPCSQNLYEGQLLVQAANKYNKVVQMGNQRRSWPNVQKGIQLLKEGVIGRAYYAKCWYATKRGSIGYGKPAEVPSNLDFDLWQGPAPRRDFQDNLVHYNWHWFWHWGAGELLNNGTHFVDLARWGLDVDYPISVSSHGGRYHFNDDQQTPDTQIVSWDFDGGKTITWEAKSCNPRGHEGSATGVSFHGTEGTLIIDGNGYTLYDMDNNVVQDSESDPADAVDRTGPGQSLDQGHQNNFFDAIQDGITPNSVIQDVNTSVHLCHLGNVAHRVGHTIHCDSHDGTIIGDREAMSYWKRTYEPGWEPTL